MAKDYSNTRKLGFLKVFQFIFVVNIVGTIFGLVFMIKGSYEILFNDVLLLTNLIFKAIAFWLILERKRFARIFVISFCSFNIIAGTIHNLAIAEFSLELQITYSLFDILTILYFTFSRRVKGVLREDFNTQESSQSSTAQIGEHENLLKRTDYYRPKTWAFWRNILIYFCVFSVVGHWLEALYCTLIRFGILPGIYDPNSQIWSDWLFPFVVYGIGAVACVLLLFPVKNLLHKRFKSTALVFALSFVINATICTLIELAMGLMLNQPLADGTMPLWDYRDMFCNFMGQVCLQNAIAFGLISTLMVWILYPLLETGMEKLSDTTANIVFIAIAVGFTILFFLYCINVDLEQLVGPLEAQSEPTTSPVATSSLEAQSEPTTSPVATSGLEAQSEPLTTHVAPST